MNDRALGPTPASGRLPLAGFVLDLSAGELYTADGDLAGLRKQALDVLLVLGARAGQVVGKDELISRVWPNVVVGEGSLTQAVVDIRRVLGDHDHRIVRNVARRGYLLLPTSGSEPAALAAPAPRPRRSAWQWAALALLAVVAVALAGLSGRGAAPVRTGDLSIVVLPLTAEGDTADAGAFADVLHNDLIAEVSRFPASLVIARATAATYRDKVVDARVVARELKVRHVVGGRLRRDAGRIRVALTLTDGESGAQRWSETFDVERARVGPALDELVAKLARALYIHAWKSAAVRADALSPTQVTADDLATRALGLWFRGLNRDNVVASLGLAEQAVAADPNSERGWAAIATGNVQALNNNWIVGAEARAAAHRRADEASAALDRIASDGFAAMQARVIEAYNRQDFRSMRQRAQLWVERHPHPVAYGALAAALYHTDQPDDAMPWLERALHVSPLDPFRAEWMHRLAWSHYIVGDLAKALEWAQQASATNPALPWPPVHAAALLQLGRRAEAQSSWDEFHRRHPAYDGAAILRRLGGDFPRFAAARAQLIEALRTLGMT